MAAQLLKVLRWIAKIRDELWLRNTSTP